MRLGIDLGGTAIKFALVDGTRVMARTQRPTEASGGRKRLLDTLIETSGDLLARYPADGIGVGVAGAVDVADGVVVDSANLPFTDEPLGDELARALHLPVALDNDANCALLGEHLAGAAVGCRDVLLLTLGTGIGGAVMIGGSLYRGHNGRAGELGHFVFDRNGPLCGCGLRGCFEHYASTTALIRLAENAARAHPESLLARLSSPKEEGKTVFDAAVAGCPVARAVLDGYGETLALGIGSLVKGFQPEAVILSGGLACAGRPLLDAVSPHLIPAARVILAAMPVDGALIGAASLLEKFSKKRWHYPPGAV